mmetsp:Transcript_4692/g.18794  ORF Transcript_4692/g.18794 Transcript_4692/m.18794 type:complete len:221 (+) Transcript_4692:4118-4780(+)
MRLTTPSVMDRSFPPTGKPSTYTFSRSFGRRTSLPKGRGTGSTSSRPSWTSTSAKSTSCSTETTFPTCFSGELASCTWMNVAFATTCAAVRMTPPPPLSCLRITHPEPVLRCAVLLDHGFTQSGSWNVTRSFTTALYSSRSNGRSSSSMESVGDTSSSSSTSITSTAAARRASDGRRPGTDADVPRAAEALPERRANALAVARADAIGAVASAADIAREA